MKLQGASVLDLVTELLIRLDAQGKPQLVSEPLAVILEGCGHEPMEAFQRILGDERTSEVFKAQLALSPKRAGQKNPLHDPSKR